MADRVPGGWIEELFPPTFTLAAEEIHNPATGDEAPAESVYERLARGRVSAMDYERMKNVYERVWLMMKMQNGDDDIPKNDKKIQVPQDISQDLSENHKSTSELIESTDCMEDTKPDANQSCIWNSKEIQMLRSAFKKTKAESNQLQAVLRATEESMHKLDEKYGEQSQQLQSCTERLHEAKKANHRLSILCKTMKAECDKNNTDMDVLRQQVSELQNENKQLSKHTHNLQMEADKERMEKHRLQETLANQKHDVERDQSQQRERLKSQHDVEVATLHRKIEELTKELQTEQQDHARSKRGLDHLRNHFASVAISDSGGTGTASANKDQLTSWTY